MSSPLWKKPFTDSMYGSISFGDAISALIQTPVVQRLRHVRLSNIDSIDMPGIANLSRFEHVLGVAHLASLIKFRTPLSQFDQLILIASALLHDWAISPFGHLVEEALQYVGTGFEHDVKLREIIRDEDKEVIGGMNLQLCSGREANFDKWSKIFADEKSDQLLDEIMQHITGHGRMGRIISGDIDIDNIDNVFRMAFHMGIGIDPGIPTRLAQQITSADKKGGPVFSTSAKADIETWRLTRQAVYQKLMLAERDFVGKLMMLYASVAAFKNKEITKNDWSLDDHTFLATLRNSTTREVRDTVSRWLSGDIWVCTPLQWILGDRPDYPTLLEFSDQLSDVLNRKCFAYGIKDKRDRHLTIYFDDNTSEEIGTNAKQWLFGVGSSKRLPFSSAEINKIFTFAQSFFNTTIIGPASNNNSDVDNQTSLF